jgi:4'-phosphopantetheinyl transferase
MTEVIVLYTPVPTLAPGLVEALSRYLDPREAERARRFVFDKDRVLFVISRALLRHALQSVAGLRHWRIEIGKFGKPELASGATGSSVQFNLSHTAGLVACALSRHHAVGVDVERTARSVDFLVIAQHWFAPSERRSLAACAPDRRAETFFRHWTIKEAIAKAMGRGITIPFADMAITLDPLSLAFAPALRQDATSWHVEEFRPTAMHRLAVAAAGGEDGPVLVRWRPVDIGSL